MDQSSRKRVIIVTDGDSQARKAVEVAAKNIGGRCISASYGNPTKISADQIIKLIKETPYDPVLVMVDDDGNQHQGIGERVLTELLKNTDIEILGVLAVASCTEQVRGVPVQYSITADGEVVKAAVDKSGAKIPDNPPIIHGDTVDVLNNHKVPIVVGIGDIGKMDHRDDYARGAPITTKAVQFILNSASNR